jgi:hypothetical protein
LKNVANIKQEDKQMAKINYNYEKRARELEKEKKKEEKRKKKEASNNNEKEEESSASSDEKN